MPVLVKEKAEARWRLKGCSRCGGDLLMEDGEWVCLQCGMEDGNKEYPFKWERKRWRRLR